MTWGISGGKITAMQTDWAAFEVNGEQHVFHRNHLRAAVKGMSNSVPVGSPRKSAAIIPSVNETLTGGLPIGSAEKWLMNSVRYFSEDSSTGAAISMRNVRAGR